MNSIRVRALLSVSIVIGGLAIAGPASADFLWRRLRNANTTHGKFYLGVSGGMTCDGDGDCGLAGGAHLMTWQRSGQDQVWDFSNTGVAVLQNGLPSYSGGTMCASAPYPGYQNSSLFIWSCFTTGNVDQAWRAVSAESLNAPFPGCFALETTNDDLTIGVYQGNVQNGSSVVLWPLCKPGSTACTNPSNAFHADQFWCPEL